MNFLFNKLPFWKNVQDAPDCIEWLPFDLDWDSGFIRQKNPQEILSIIHKNYNNAEYNFISQPPGRSNWANRIGDEKIDFIKKINKSLKDKVVLEIGAGSLYIAERLIKEFDVAEYIVIDPAIRETSNNPKISVRKEYFDRTTYIDKKIDLVISLSCLEHVLDPVEYLLSIRKILKSPDGALVLVFPDIEDQFIRGDFNAILHEHVNYFTKDTAIQLFIKNGFKILLCDEKPDVLKMILEVGDSSFSHPFIRKNYDKFYEKSINQFKINQQRIKNYLLHSMQTKTKVAFHGANNGLNTVIALSDLEDTSNIWIFDGDETKTGKFLPSCVNPIMNSKDPFYKSMNNVIVSATSFYDEIREFLIQYQKFESASVKALFPFKV